MICLGCRIGINDYYNYYLKFISENEPTFVTTILIGILYILSPDNFEISSNFCKILDIAFQEFIRSTKNRIPSYFLSR
jgi:hypothetical protein